MAAIPSHVSRARETDRPRLWYFVTMPRRRPTEASRPDSSGPPADVPLVSCRRPAAGSRGAAPRTAAGPVRDLDGTAPRASRAEVARHVDRADALIGAGYTDGRAARILARETGMSTRNALRYVVRAREEWRSGEGTRPADAAEAYAAHRDRFASLFETALSAGNLRAALAAADRLAQLDGHLAARSTDVRAPGSRREPMGDEEAEQVVEVLTAAGMVFPEELRRALIGNA